MLSNASPFAQALIGICALVITANIGRMVKIFAICYGMERCPELEADIDRWERRL